MLDTGAEVSIFDGRAAERAGWGWDDVVARARDVKPIHGLAHGGRVIPGYELEVMCFVGSAIRFAELRIQALVTPPDSITYPVLGRAGFFEQVDVTFTHAESTLYIRFRDPALSRLFE